MDVGIAPEADINLRIQSARNSGRSGTRLLRNLSIDGSPYLCSHIANMENIDSRCLGRLGRSMRLGSSGHRGYASIKRIDTTPSLPHRVPLGGDVSSQHPELMP